MTAAACPLCQAHNETVLWSDAHCRAILVNDTDYPGFCRAVWHAHVREMTDLPPAQRAHFLGVVWALEASLREILRPEKINLASLGNQVPHLHWHVIPRFRDDKHFPDPIWSAPKREGAKYSLDFALLKRTLLANLDEILRSQLKL